MIILPFALLMREQNDLIVAKELLKTLQGLGLPTDECEKMILNKTTWLAKIAQDRNTLINMGDMNKEVV